MKPYYQHGGVTLYHADCQDVLPGLEAVDVVLTDPPYPNNAGHFDDAVDAARRVLSTFRCRHWISFWDEMEVPPVNLPLVGRHIWHRTNTNRPDNYEAIYEFHADGKKRPSRVFPAAVICPGLTGCYEATGHPTQKNLRLIRALLLLTEGTVFDPFAGSGTTLLAAKQAYRRAVGVEVNEAYCEIAANRLAQEVLPLEVAA